MATDGEILGDKIRLALEAAGVANVDPTLKSTTVWHIIGTELVAEFNGGGGGGGVTGPASSTINAIALWADANGTAIKNSGIKVIRNGANTFDVFVMTAKGGTTFYLWIDETSPGEGQLVMDNSVPG